MMNPIEPPAVSAGGSNPRLVSKSGDKRGETAGEGQMGEGKKEEPAVRRSGRTSSRPQLLSEEFVDAKAESICFQRQDVMELCPTTCLC